MSVVFGKAKAEIATDMQCHEICSVLLFFTLWARSKYENCVLNCAMSLYMVYQHDLLGKHSDIDKFFVRLCYRVLDRYNDTHTNLLTKF